MIDRNKTPLTHRITALAAAYLDAHGFKPIETEVPVAPGWIADLASFIYPTKTEAKKLHLTKHAKTYLGRPDPLYLYGENPLTALVEVKISHQDFVRDPKFNTRNYPASFCILAYPRDILQARQLPAGWIGLECAKNGARLLEVHRYGSYVHAQFAGAVANFIAAVAIRRDHRTRYAATRDWINSYRAKDRKKQQRFIAERLIEDLATWLQNTGFDADLSFAAWLERHHLKERAYLREAASLFESLKAKNPP